jgi:hypothetical protein
VFHNLESPPHLALVCDMRSDPTHITLSIDVVAPAHGFFCMKRVIFRISSANYRHEVGSIVRARSRWAVVEVGVSIFIIVQWTLAVSGVGFWCMGTGRHCLHPIAVSTTFWGRIDYCTLCRLIRMYPWIPCQTEAVTPSYFSAAEGE